MTIAMGDVAFHEFVLLDAPALDVATHTLPFIHNERWRGWGKRQEGEEGGGGKRKEDRLTAQVIELTSAMPKSRTQHETLYRNNY